MQPPTRQRSPAVLLGFRSFPAHREAAFLQLLWVAIRGREVELKVPLKSPALAGITCSQASSSCGFYQVAFQPQLPCINRWDFCTRQHANQKSIPTVFPSPLALLPGWDEPWQNCVNSAFMKSHFIFSTFHVEEWKLEKSLLECSLFFLAQENIFSLF